MKSKPAIIALADGRFFEGEAMGADGISVGEVVFNTSMTGYQEILTDPSYRGQILTMTTVHVGNYGINPFDGESAAPQVAGFVVREASRVASNHRATQTLDGFLVENGVVGIAGVDTRAITRRVRDGGAIMGCVAHGRTRTDLPELLDIIAKAPSYDSIDHVAAVSVRQPTIVRAEPTGDNFMPTRPAFRPYTEGWSEEESALPLVVALDYGIKWSILRRLLERPIRLLLLPHATSAAELKAYGAAGLLLSNGPGDPGRMDSETEVVRELVGELPIFGICLGHQLLCRALGASTYKLAFGHRGPNQPAGLRGEGRIEITSQNHGYAVQWESIPDAVQVTQRNLNDETIEAVAMPSLRAFSVQHHPEAGPGPHDALGAFATFHGALGGA